MWALFSKIRRRRKAKNRMVVEPLEQRILLSSTGLSAPIDSSLLEDGSGSSTAEQTSIVTPDLAFSTAELTSADMISLTPVSASANTGEKPQSKVWQHADQWWAVFPDSSGSALWRLDGTEWSRVLDLSSNTGTHADVKVDGNLAHILLYDGTSSQLVSLEFLPGVPNTYQPWSLQPNIVDIQLSSGVETATIDIDSTGRMWLASDASSTVEVRYSDLPYLEFSGPVTVATGITSDDISAVTALPNGSIGVFWSDQSDERFGFRTHLDGTDPTSWSANEVPASQSALNIGGGMADDHLNVAVASDGTLYAAIKTGYDSSGRVKIGLLVRRPSGQWDPLYEVDTTGTRGIVAVNEATNRLIVAYTSSDSGGDILYRESPLDVISLSPIKTLIAGSLNNVSSTKQSLTSEMLFIAGGGGQVHGTLINLNVTPDPTPAPTINAIADRSIIENSGTTSVLLTGLSSGIGDPEPIRITATSSMPGIIPDPLVIYQQGSDTADLQFTPLPNQTGLVTITVVVEDAGIDLNFNTLEDNLTTSRTFLVQINELNVPPMIVDQSFGVVRRSSSGTEVGVISASDSNSGQSLTYSVVSATDSQAFDVDSSTGRITVDRRRSIRQTGTHQVVVRVTDNGNPAQSSEATMTIRVVNSSSDLNQAGNVQIQPTVAGIDENVIRVERLHVADLTIIDDGVGTNSLGLSGTDALLFEIEGYQLYLKPGAGFDYESISSLNVNITVDDSTIPGDIDNATAFSLSIQDVNEPPSGLDLQNAVTTIAETFNTSTRQFVADLVVVDDALGNYVFNLSGDDSTLFEVIGQQLFLKAGTVLNRSLNPTLDVTVSVDDLGVGTTTDATASLSIQVTEVPENSPPAISEQDFSVARRSSAGTFVGEVIASDEDLEQQLTYEIISGATAAFEIDSRNGELTVRRRRAIRSRGDYQIVVRVTDNGTPNLSREATITVRVV